MDIFKEVCVGNYEEARKAVELGGNRIELCDNLMEGGTTPSYGTIFLAKKRLNIDINVIIRPRGGNFVYSEEEIEIMERDIEICKEIGVNGIVIGALREDNTLDEETIRRLVKKAEGLSVTFHMAFNKIENKKLALDKLVDIGIDRILTAGEEGHAMDNIPVLKELVDYAGERIIILPGAGVTYENYLELVEKTGAKEVHGTKIVGNLV
ncbi:copper homeostasis protein CutC [Tissierella sp. MSJ-40]|uniref:PF03932 family protein CutC n=1 Tax=Tissierella simiarum TaxID=2841534 RepID=A0ABS6E1D6_9FIRM|nr:copper homeostasis protein CutC [Tissierella simiarum]MBU5436609.1 copper homeostasis protein CutC [Tissierella simiarum]